jgi:four helix bundle protein
MAYDRKDLEKRLFNFAVAVIKFLRKLKRSKENEVIRYQLAKSATSMGANYEKAGGAISRSEFKFKIGICFKEAKESNYWIRIIKAAGISQSRELEYLITESGELKNIFGQSMKTLKK